MRWNNILVFRVRLGCIVVIDLQKQNKECAFVGYKIYQYHKNARSNTYQSAFYVKDTGNCTTEVLL
jgi:hypothetical protein